MAAAVASSRARTSASHPMKLCSPSPLRSRPEMGSVPIASSRVTIRVRSVSMSSPHHVTSQKLETTPWCKTSVQILVLPLTWGAVSAGNGPVPLLANTTKALWYVLPTITNPCVLPPATIDCPTWLAAQP